MKNVVVLGSTGSVGRQALKVLKKLPEFEVVAISAHSDRDLLKQAKRLKFRTENVVLASEQGEDAISKQASLKEADIIINAISGTAGIPPTKAAIKAGKTLLLANKESVIAERLRAGDKLIPLDSEHNAIYEILKSRPQQKIKKIIIPCSGGPFYHRRISST